MKFLNAFANKFYSLPGISSFFESHAMLRIAKKSYGTPLFIIILVLLFLVLILLVSKLKPKKGRPKPIVEEQVKTAPKPGRKRAKREKKPKGTPKAILRKLEKLPSSSLPLYPVADKKRSLDAAIEQEALQPAPGNTALDPVPEDMALETDMPLSSDDASSDFSAPTPAPEAETDFINPADFNIGTEQPTDFDQASHGDADLDLSEIGDQAAMDGGETATTADTSPFGGGLTGDDFDINVPSFGGEADQQDADGLSDEARRKFEELQQRGITT